MKKLLTMIGAAAIALATALPSLAADWTDANDATYTALKSINGGGSGLIVTDDFTPAGTEIVKFKYKPSKVSGNECVFCSRYIASKQSKAQFCGFRISNKLRFDRCDYYTSKGTDYPRQSTCNTTTLSAGEEYSVVANFGGASAGTVTINDTPQTLSPAMVTANYTPGSVLVLLASHTLAQNVTPTSSSTFDNKATGDLYYFQLWNADGKTLEHDFRPAKRVSDDAIGLYDTATRKFWPATIGSFTGAAYSANDRAGKKWTGAGGDNKMSTAANWQGGVAPSAGDDLDFTIAVPFAAIDADIDATFGKVYLGTGDIPAFIGSLTATAVNDLTRMQAYDAATAGFTFTLEAPTGQDFTWNGAAAANWWATDIWTYNSAASSWYDNNNAIFNTANATATLDADATAASVAFNAPAIIGGAATLTVPTVSVASGVSATISAPTAGALEKTGAGTLALTQSRTAATTLTEGTLKMSPGATVSDLTLGTSDPTKPVVFDYGGQTLTAAPETYLVTGSAVTLTNGTFAANGMLAIRDSKKLPSVLTIAKGAELYKYGADQLVIDAAGEATVNVVGGTIRQTENHRVFIQDASTNGTLRINVTDGSLLEFPRSVLALCCAGNYAYDSPSLYMVINDSTFRVKSEKTCDIDFGCPDDELVETYLPINPKGVLAATNSVFDIGDAIRIGRNLTSEKTAGSYTADFENCVITAKTFAVNHDRPLNNARFNGTRFVFGAASGSIAANDGADNWFTIGTDGLTIDTQAYSATLNANLGGPGAVTKVGSGRLAIRRSQTASAALNIDEGTAVVSGGLSLERPIAVAAGATFSLNGSAQTSVADLSLADGATLDIASYTPGTVPMAVTTLNFPASGTVNLTLGGGAFRKGIYEIYARNGVTAADGEKFAPSTGSETVAWSVEGNTLVLTVGTLADGFWTGLGGDGKMSTGANWATGVVPGAGMALDFSSVLSATTVDADTGVTYGAVTMGDAVITFTNSLTATGFSNGLKVAVGQNSTVTVAGDYVFSASVAEYIVNSVAAGGAFRVTGRIVANSSKTGNLYPCVSGSIAGTIEANGLVHNGNGGGFWLARNQNGSHASWAIGADGISGTKLMGYTGNDNINNFSASITATADFTVTTPIVNRRTLTLNPAGHVITLGTNTATSAGAIIGGSNASNVIAGPGKVVANYTIGTYSKNNPFTIETGATLELIPGVDLGTGLVTVQDGGTLGVAESGTVTLNGGLTLDDGATLAFNFTESANPPVLALATGKSVIFTSGASTNIAVKVSGARPRGGEKILTTCGGFNTDGVNVSLAEDVPNWVKGLSVNGDGDIVLDVKPFGTIIIVR